MDFSIKELVAKAHFDYVGPMFPTWWAKNKTKFVLPSLLGINSALLNNGRYFQRLIVSYDGQQYEFPNEPLIGLSLSKTIVETATVGKERKGTVKEYICTEDYEITIKGLCVHEDSVRRDEYPAEQVQELHRLFEINDSLEVVGNPFLELFGIRNIVLKDLELEEMAGEQGMQKFTVSAVSDQDFYADLTAKEKAVEAVSKMNFLAL